MKAMNTYIIKIYKLQIIYNSSKYIEIHFWKIFQVYFFLKRKNIFFEKLIIFNNNLIDSSD